LVDFFDQHRDLCDVREYHVQSDVPTALFSAFVEYMRTSSSITITIQSLFAAQEHQIEVLVSLCSFIHRPNISRAGRPRGME
jgi:hypothetical protein